ncbi:MAG: UvrD-helicase domain-containing protein [Verrucomicrobiota bacterium]
MEQLPPATTDTLTPAQRLAVEARGNVLVMAGAGTGKTKTLVARCLDCLARERVSLDEFLIVTFTEAAAAELRHRLRRELEKQSASAPGDEHWERQLALFDLAHIGTLHSFCLRLIRENFHEPSLALDPQLAILDQGEARQLANETLDEQLEAHYAGTSEYSRAVQNLIEIYGAGRDQKIRALILRVHDYSQTRPDPAGWINQQIQQFAHPEALDWRNWLLAAITDWRAEWLLRLQGLESGNVKAAELTKALRQPDRDFTRKLGAEMLEQIMAMDANWPARQKTILRQPLKDIFLEAAFLLSLAAEKNGNDPLAEDWNWVRGHMKTLLQQAAEFTERFAARKRTDGVVDFHDLEQFALKLLWDAAASLPSTVAETWRARLKFVFVDEYQDINAAQDRIIAAVSRDEKPGIISSDPGLTENAADARLCPSLTGNRFLVGDVKQSIYRFRLADPKIFRDYARVWRREQGRVIALAENFRSSAGLLSFVNSVFSLLMREEIGGVAYDQEAQLQPGRREEEAPDTPDKAVALAGDESLRVVKKPPVELLVRIKTDRANVAADDLLADLADAEREARHVAFYLKRLITSRTQIMDDQKRSVRPVEWRDVAVLLRSPSGKAEIFAKQFELAGVPLAVSRSGFYQTAEILDLLSLLQLLDNPLQDVPCIAVLRSPFVGLSLDELAGIRLAAKDQHFWMALNQVPNCAVTIPGATVKKISLLLERYSRWRLLAKQHALTECLEAVLTETLYLDWLRLQPRGVQRAANVNAFLQLAQTFDQFQRQGLYRFLNFITAQQAAEAEPEIAATITENAVRLMSIHQSKGLEFPVVVLPDLAKKFNEQDQSAEIIFDEKLGLCPKVKPPTNGRRYPSLPHWLAQRRQHRELRGEEQRLLYVALTRARAKLVLTVTLTEKKWESLWQTAAPVSIPKILEANSFADWLGLWFGAQTSATKVSGGTGGELDLLSWRWLTDDELAGGLAPSPGASGQAEAMPAPNDNLFQTDPSLLALRERLQAMLAWQYGQTEATRHQAKYSVTELRRSAEPGEEEAELLMAEAGLAPHLPKLEINNSTLKAEAYGTAHHKFLQHFVLEKSGDLAGEADRLLTAKIISVEEREALNLRSLAAFWNSELGRAIQMHSPAVRRELPFTARFSPAEINAITGRLPDDGLAGEYLVLQGVADLVVRLPDEIWLVDFKTDAVTVSGLPEKLRRYTPQLALYSVALEKIFKLPVTRRILHFLALDKSVAV